ncbi:MAG TPA: Hsp20/alpha crystallin family protein [Pricia sp.]|nr:Hsp20/alpha crystallin family protein [Pricia sp.]
MSLVKFRNRDPLRNFLTSDVFDNDDILSDRFWFDDITELAMNVKETDGNLEIELAAPGYSKKDFNVTIENGCLNISAENSSSIEEEEEDYSRQEFSYTSFEKSLRLPENVKDEEIKATYKDGVLKFKLEKKEHAKKHVPMKIAVS